MCVRGWGVGGGGGVSEWCGVGVVLGVVNL